jgi:hypothetical protein
MSIQYLPELNLTPGPADETFAIADSWIVTTYVLGEWNGSPGNIVSFHSDIPDTQVSVDITAIGIIYVSYFSAQDINFVGGVVYYDSTCTNVSDNTNFNFSNTTGNFFLFF